jgi:hypothetical protein
MPRRALTQCPHLKRKPELEGLEFHEWRQAAAQQLLTEIFAGTETHREEKGSSLIITTFLTDEAIKSDCHETSIVSMIRCDLKAPFQLQELTTILGVAAAPSGQEQCRMQGCDPQHALSCCFCTSCTTTSVASTKACESPQQWKRALPATFGAWKNWSDCWTTAHNARFIIDHLCDLEHHGSISDASAYNSQPSSQQ